MATVSALMEHPGTAPLRGATALTAAGPLTALAQATPRFKIIAFSKPFADLKRLAVMS